MASLDYHGVCFSYPNSKLLLDNISFQLQEGEILAIIGSNGAGKSTLLRLANKLLKPQKGFIKIGDMMVDSQLTSQIAHQLVLTFQFSRSQFFTPSVEKELETVIRLHHDSKEEQDTYLSHLLENFGLVHQRKSPPYQLSGGEQRKLILALAFASSAIFFLFDEPTANLDQTSRKFLLSKLISLKDNNKGVLVVSHDLEFVFAVADRILVLDRGQIAYIGSTYDLLKNVESHQNLFSNLPAIYSFLMKTVNKNYMIKEINSIIPEHASFTPVTLSKKILEVKENGN
jgi:energy-coupling factor transporter ATP-binding protein EcfA2